MVQKIYLRAIFRRNNHVIVMKKEIEDLTILQFIDSLAIGGAERMAVNISNALVGAGAKVILCASRGSGPLEAFVDAAIEVVHLRKKSGFDLIAFLRLLKILRKYRVDVIHAHSSSIFWAVGTRLFFPKIKIIWHDHSGDVGKLDGNRKKSVIRISRFIDGILSVNEPLKDWAIQFTKVRAEKIFYIGNFPMLSPVGEASKKNDGILKIICLANLRAQKDHFTLVEAIALVREHLPEVTFKLILAGNYFDDDYYRNLIGLIRKKNLEAIIEIKGSVTNTATLLYQADIGVLSSISEGLPVSLLEYGLARLAVVVTDVGQCAEVVGHGAYGLVVAASNPEELAAGLIRLLEDRQLREQYGTDFKEHITVFYGYERFLRDYKGLLTKVVDK